MITGYKLYADDGLGGQFALIQTTVGLTAKVNEYLHTGLLTSRQYRFKVVAFNFNEEAGPESDISAFHACDLPGNWDKPQKLTTTESSISIVWNEPKYNGGCSIQGYSVLIDDGNEGAFIEANYDNDIAVRWKPSLSRLEITRLQLLNIGKTFRIKLKARNFAGEVESPILGVVLAGLPLMPPQPVKVAQLCSDTVITIDISDFPLSANGGCPVISYEIQQDDGRGGMFLSKVGKQSPYLMRYYVTTGLQKGRTYRFRYRAQNC